MFHRKEFDKTTGVYRTPDRIENFRFRITLKTLHSFVKVPKFNAEQLTDAEDLDEIEFYNFRWQQKRFNDAEVQRYSDADNCKTDTEKRYHQQVTGDAQYAADSADATVARKVFSYVSDDKFVDPNDVRSFSALAPKVEKSSEWDTLIGAGQAELLPEDAGEQQIHRTRYKNLSQFESMHIMADLGREILLFTIKYRSHDGLLLIYPDFNSIDANPYLKEIVSDSRHLYQYAIQNISVDLGSDDDWPLKDDIEMMANKLSQLFIKSPTLFNLPPKQCTRVSVCIEIETAKHFEYDCIHVKYRVALPNRCENIDDSERIGSTHSSQRNSVSGDWLIGHCHELNILCHRDYRLDDQLKIMYEVVSIDGWERERTEGYAIVSIPLLPGRFREKIRCYRDLGNDTWIDWLQRYFVGGRRKVRFNEFNGITGDGTNCNRTMNELNRYGNKTETTGYLSIVRNVIVQRHVDARARSTNASKSRRRRVAKLHNLLSTYQEARERLEAITEM